MVDGTYNEFNKNSFSDNAKTDQNDSKRPYKVQAMWDIHFIALDDAIHPQQDEWFTQERKLNGDILLKRRTFTP